MWRKVVFFFNSAIIPGLPVLMLPASSPACVFLCVGCDLGVAPPPPPPQPARASSPTPMWVNEQQQQQKQAEVLRGAARRLGWPTQPSFNAGTLLWGPIDAQASLQEGGETPNGDGARDQAGAAGS